MTAPSGRWITLREAAAHLSVSLSYLYQKGEALGLPRYKVGRQYRYDINELDAWVKAQDRA